MNSGLRTSVLILEHDPGVRSALSRLLERLGLTPLPASTVRAAVRSLRRHRSTLALVVADLDLGEENGLALVAHLRRRARHLPIVVFAASNEEREHATALGVSACLPMPTATARITQAVRRALAEERTQCA
jgi:two-component system response regulator MprA